jgi:hypothetical protein
MGKMDFRDIILKHKFDREEVSRNYERDEYIIKYEGYAYVLYKKILVKTKNWSEVFEEPIAHFRDMMKLDVVLEILFEKFDEA